MTFTITKFRLAMAVLVVALIAPTTAWATHVFVDVPDDAFFAAATIWARDNGITTGTGDGSTFSPGAPVTRGENITFAHRYDTNVVQPALTTLAEGVIATMNQLGRVAASSGDVIDNWDGSLIDTFVTVTAPTAGFITVIYNIDFDTDGDETGTGIDFLTHDIWVDAEPVSNVASSLLDFDICCSSSESVSVQATIAVGEGTHTIVGFSILDSAPTTTNLVFVIGRAISAQFVPLDGNGFSPSTFGALSLSRTATAEAPAQAMNHSEPIDIERSQELRAAWWADQ